MSPRSNAPPTTEVRIQGEEAAEARQPVPGLAQLDALIEQVRSAGLDTTLEVRGEAPDVPVGVQLTVYRLVQEALTNTLKHGGAGARATVRLRFQPGELLVDIDDDGAGVPPAPQPASGSAPATAGGGLVGMRERARAYGGDVQAGPREPGGWRSPRGCCLTAVMPRDPGAAGR